MVTASDLQQAALAKALALAALDPPVYVVPCWRRGKEKGPCTAHGFRDASTDPNTIRQLWAERPGTEVGIWPGPSQLLVEDIDVDESKGVNGYRTVDNQEVAWESVVHYLTPSRGEHHVWPAFDFEVGPAAPIHDFPGIDRRSGDSLCLWYGPVPNQDLWTKMHAQTTPRWLAGPAKRGTRSRATRFGAKIIEPVESEDVILWIDSLSAGEEPVEALIRPTEHYGDLLSALVRLAEHSRRFPTTPGLRATFDVLTDAYLNSSVATTPADVRPSKIIGMVRWALGATADVEDMTWAFERWSGGKTAVPAVPTTSDESHGGFTRESSVDLGTAGTGAEVISR